MCRQVITTGLCMVFDNGAEADLKKTNSGIFQYANIFLGLILSVSLVMAADEQPERVPDSLQRHVVRTDSRDTQMISAMVRMGMEELESEKGDPDQARKMFEKALELDPANYRSYIGIGRSYLHRKSRKLRILEAIERIFDQDYLSRSIRNFAKAIEVQPEIWEAHYWMGTACMRKLDREWLEKAKYHMNRAAELGGGDNRDIRFKQAMLAKALGNEDDAERLLEGISRHDVTGNIDPLAYLELSKLYVKRGRVRDGLACYWQGVGAIKTRSEFETYFDDVRMIASRTEHEVFDSTDAATAQKYFRNFWLSRDHELGLAPGMRLARHYQRLSIADSLYRVPFPIRNPSLSPQVAYVPEEGVPYDDRGIVYIHHGPPNNIITHTDFDVHPNETWVYHRAHDDMILNFVALNGNREYQLVYSLAAAVSGNFGNMVTDSDGNIYPRDEREAEKAQKIKDLFGSRIEIGRGLYFRLYNHPGDQFVRMEEYERNYYDIYSALNSESVELPYRRQLTSYYDLVDFRGNTGDGKSVLEFYAGVPGKEITFRQSAGNRYNYDIAYSLELFDSDWSRVETFRNVEPFESAINPNELLDRLVVGLGRVELKPGEYNYFVNIQNGNAYSQFNGHVTVDAFNADSLLSSGIVAANDVRTAVSGSTKFSRHSLEVQPNPSRIFRPSDKMYAYQEIYNLTPGSDGNYNYRLTYTITQLKDNKNVFGHIYGGIKWLFGQGDGDEQVVLAVEKSRPDKADDALIPENVEIDISSNPEGLYQLSIKVEDLNNLGRTFERNTQFIVRKD